MAKSDQKRQAALAALMDSSTLTEAAEKAGISRRTLYNYLRNDIEFARAYDEIRDRQAVDFMDDLNDRRRRAHAVIMELLEDAEQPAAIRLKAAQTILTAAAEQDKTVAGIVSANINANKDMFDLSFR